MSDYYTQAVQTAPITGAPLLALLVLSSVSGGNAFAELLADLDIEAAAQEKLVLGLLEYGLLQTADGGPGYEWDSEVAEAAHEMTCMLESDGLYLSWERSFSEAVAPLLQWFLDQLPADVRYLIISGAHTCEKMRPDGFGGFSCVITRDDVRWFSTDDAVECTVRGILDPVDVDTFLAKEWPEGGFDREMREFISSRGLEVKLLQYIRERRGG